MKKTALVLGGGILTLFFISKSVVAYDQPNTHPALTKAAGDFYNLSFPKNKISEEEIKLLMKGAYDEDQPPRWLNHSYDPVHNKAWVGYRTSKVWAMSSDAQQINKHQYALNPIFSEKINSEEDFYDFSYERALLDYAKGNRNRAFEALGHVFHLLEDSNVPEHTRLDIHLPWHGTESPYEKTMAKWNPQNIDVVQKLVRQREKPILINSLDKYFDEIAGYSNNYFFSEDTIFSSKYPGPNVDFWRYENIDDELIAFGYKKDKDKNIIRLVKQLEKLKTRNVVEQKLFTVDEKTILDGYWSRLSKDFVLHGAGVIKMFLEQGEEAKKEYERQMALKKETKKSFLGNILGFGGGEKVDGIKLVRTVLREVEDRSRSDLFKDSRSDLVNVGISDDGNRSQATESPRSDLFEDSRSDLNGETTTTTPTSAQAVTTTTAINVAQFFSGGGSGGGSQTSATATTTTTVTTTTLAPSPSPAPETALDKSVINEIAWMGTASSSSDGWLEVYNISSVSTDISGWTLKSQDGTPDISLAFKSIDPFGFYLLERTSNDTISDIFADQIYTGALGNSGEILELRDSGGKLQDIVSKSNSGSWYAGDNPNKKTMERVNPLASGSDSGNWSNNNGIIKNGADAGGNAINGTPRAKNSVFVGQKPSKISNLAITSTSGNQINFSWSAPLDNDTLSANLQYDFRYATKSFDLSADWEVASKSLGLPLVDNFGKTSTHFITIDDFGNKYYFAIKTKDVDGNFSDISNQVNQTLPSAVSDISWSMSGLNSTHSLKTSFLGPVASTSATKWGIQLLSSPPINFSQPVLAPNGYVYYGASNGTLAQLSATVPSGTESWHYTAPSGATIGTPVALSDSSVLFGYINIASDFTKLSASGSAKFTSAIGAISSVTVDNYGITYFTTTADKLFAVTPNGAQKWQTSKDGIDGFSPIVYDGKIYITARISGVPTFYAFDAENGNFIWSKTMSTNSPSCCGISDISYDSVNDYLYAGADQYILKIDRSGNTLEQFLADRQVGWGYATTMVSQDTDNLVFGLDFSPSNPASKSAVYAVNKSTKDIAWKYQVDAKINKQIAIDSGGNSYFSTQNGWVYSLSQSGGLNWKIDLSGTTSAYPVIGTGVLYITLDGARLVKIGE